MYVRENEVRDGYEPSLSYHHQYRRPVSPTHNWYVHQPLFPPRWIKVVTRWLLGLFSLNVTVPTNPHQPGGSHVIFGVLFIILALTIAVFLSIVRYWWETSKRQQRRRAPL
jgi:hypothetical protein